MISPPPELSQIYFYKMTADNGGAPCVYRGLLSLAICKPRIRRGASIGDIIFGFGGSALDERLIYLAVVTDRESNGDYYRQAKYQKRPDCIYRWKGKTLEWKRGSRFHLNGNSIIRDVGAPGNHHVAAVLLSSDFRYFGNEGSTEYKKQFPLVGRVIHKLGQGERKYHGPNLREELLGLKDHVWSKYPRNKMGEPIHSDLTANCARSEGLGGC